MQVDKKQLLSSHEYQGKRQKADDEKNYLKDYCDQIVRRLITELVRARPEDVLDHMSKWVSRERGVPLPEVEAEVLDHVKKHRIKRDDRLYVLDRRPTFQTHVSEEPVLPGELPVLDKQVSLPGDPDEPANKSSQQRDEEFVERSDEEFKADASLSERLRKLRLLNASLTFKSFSKETKAAIADRLVEASYV